MVETKDTRAYSVKWHEGRNVYQIIYSERQPNGSYRSRAISTGIRDRSRQHEAEIFKVEWLDHQRSIERGYEEPRISQLVEDYRHDAVARQVNKSRLYILKTVDRLYGHFRVSAIDQKDINAINAERTVGPATIRAELTTLRTVVNYAHRTKRLDANIRLAIALPKEPQGNILFLDEQQEPEFYAYACGLSIGQERLTPLTKFTVLGLDTGARKSALQGLTWDRVSFMDNMIDFREPGRPISGKRRGVVPINSRLMPLLKRAYQERSKADRNLVCGRLNVHDRWGEWIKTTPYPWMTPHMMRHTFATLSLKAGATINEVAELLADTPQTIWRTYSHVSSTWLRDAAEARLQKFMS